LQEAVDRLGSVPALAESREAVDRAAFAPRRAAERQASAAVVVRAARRPAHVGREVRWRLAAVAGQASPGPA